MRIFLLILLFSTSAFANLDRLIVENLNLVYNLPYGKGDVEKITIGFSTKKAGPYPVEIHRTDKTLEVKSPFADIAWNEPWAIFHDMEHLSAAKVNASFGKKDHSADVASAAFRPKDMGEFKLSNISVKCNGTSSYRRIENRLMDDCRESLELKVQNLDVPVDLSISKILAQLPPMEELPEAERPADSLRLISDEGDFSLVVYTKVLFYAGLRAWGHVFYEDNHSMVIIRVDKIKFGHLPITRIVLRELRQRINHPNVTIMGNYIRIKVQLR